MTPDRTDPSGDDRRQTVRDELGQSEDLLAAILDTSVAAICVLDPEGRIVFANPAAETVLGLTPSDVLQRRYNSPEWKVTAIDGSEWPSDEYPFSQVMRTSKPVRNVQHAIEWPDGRRRLLSINGAPILDDDGRIDRLVFSITDITDRVEMEERMRESTTWLRLALEETKMGIWSWDCETNEVRWSDEVAPLFGVKSGVFAGTYEAFLDLVHPDDVPRVNGAVRAAVASNSDSLAVDYRLIWPDGTEHWLESRAQVFRDAVGRPTRLTGTVVDITARRSVEQALQTSEDAFRTLLETVPSYIVSVAPDRTIRFLNRTLPHLRMEDVVGQDVVQFMAENVRDAYAAALERAFSTGELQELEGTTLSPGGESSSFLLRMGPVKKDNVVESVTIVGVDLTQLKRAEEALLASQEQLRHVRRLESVGRLAGGVAHDFNNMLTVIIGSLELLESKLGQRTDLLDLTRAIADAAERGAALTRQLLAFARKKIVQPQILDLNVQIRASADLLRRLIGEDVELDLILRDEVCAVEMDPGQFEQVLVNLAINARDAMPDGGRLTIASRIRSDRAVDTPDGQKLPRRDWVVVTIRDTGVGIGDEQIPFIFEPFYTTKPTGEGTGLGLATCFGIVGQAGGTIDVDSRPGHGASFNVMLPRVDGHPERGPEKELTHGVHEGSGTILLVEDEAMVRSVSRSILERAGYDVIEAENGQVALDLFRANVDAIDLVITDIGMPKMSGVALAREIIPLNPTLRVLLVSGYSKELDSPTGLLQDRIYFLEKPYSADTLTKMIRTILGEA